MTDIQYSNDGLLDVGGVFLNTNEIKWFTSNPVVKCGDGLNVFQSSGLVKISHFWMMFTHKSSILRQQGEELINPANRVQVCTCLL